MVNITLFSQIIANLDYSKFSKIVKEKRTNKHQKGFSSIWSRCYSASLQKSQSLRDMSNNLRSANINLNNLFGISKATIKIQNKLS